MKKLSVALALTVLAAAACAPPAAQDSPEIRAGSAAWTAALNAGDLDGIVAVYADDAYIMAPGAAPASGHDAVRASFGPMVEAGLGGTLTTTEVAAAGDIGYHFGTYEITANGETADTGKYMEIWRRQDGQWKIHADIWNSDGAADSGNAMLIGTHQVEDPEVWLAAWAGADGRRADFAANGAPGVRVFQSPEDPNLTGLAIEVSDMAAFTTWLESEEGTQAKAEDGVVDSTVQILAEVK